MLHWLIHQAFFRSFAIPFKPDATAFTVNRGYADYFRDYANDVCTKTFKIPNNKFALRLYGSYKAIGTFQIIKFVKNMLTSNN